MPNDREEKVGYGKPPTASRFKKGQSGNPKGRPKGSPNLLTLLQKASREKVPVTENGRRRMVTMGELAIKQLTTQAGKGDLKAINLYCQLIRYAEEKSPGGNIPEKDVLLDDADLIACLMKRYAQPTGGDQ